MIVLLIFEQEYYHNLLFMNLLEQQIEAAVLLEESKEDIQKSVNMILDMYSKPDTGERGQLQALLLSVMKLCISTARLEYVHQKLLKDDTRDTEKEG